MAKIICITTGLTGILNASFELVHRLQQEGHECVCASPKNVGDAIERQGFQYHQLAEVNYEPAPELPNFKGPFRKIKRWLYKIQHRQARQQAAIQALGMDKFLREIEKIQPDLVIVDIELHEHIMALYTAKQPILLLSQWFSTWNRKGLPPIIHSTTPNQGWRGNRLGLWLSWQQVKLHRWWMFFKKKLTSMATDRRSILLAYAKYVCFPLAYIRENYWPGPFSYAELPVISMTLQELDFPHDVRPNLTYVGAMVYPHRKDIGLDEKVESQINDILDTCRNQGKQLIYCSVSTFKAGDTKFLEKVVEAVEGQPDWVLIIGLGGKIKAETFASLPANVFAFAKVPQLAVLAQADLSINHGGIHTINECLHFEVPMLVYSGQRSDQNGCAARVHYHGLGLMADKNEATSQSIQRNIQSVLRNGQFKQKAQEVNRLNRNYDALGKTVRDVLKSN